MRPRVALTAIIALLAGATLAMAQGAVPTTASMTAGQAGYTRNCQVCHGANGEGGIGFRLTGAAIMQSAAGVVEVMLEGNAEHGMPPFNRLTDTDIAAIASYVRNAWGNSFGPVETTLVAQVRQNLAAGGE